jgi:hypothetical protein
MATSLQYRWTFPKVGAAAPQGNAKCFPGAVEKRTDYKDVELILILKCQIKL